jgi:hypothetical protein
VIQVILSVSALGMFEHIVTHFSQTKNEVAVEDAQMNLGEVYSTFRT